MLGADEKLKFKPIMNVWVTSPSANEWFCVSTIAEGGPYAYTSTSTFEIFYLSSSHTNTRTIHLGLGTTNNKDSIFSLQISSSGNMRDSPGLVCAMQKSTIYVFAQFADANKRNGIMCYSLLRL